MTLPQSLRIIFMADTHLGFDYPVKPRIDRRRRGHDFFNNFKKVLDYAELVQADLVIHGGDFFFRAKVPGKIVELAYSILNDFAGRGIPVYIVPGNHERSRLPSTELIDHETIHVFDAARTYLTTIKGMTVAVAGFPFQRKELNNQFPVLLKQSGWSEQSADINILCFHQTVEGAQVGPSNFVFTRGKDVIAMDALPGGFDLILSGHIHRRQVLKRESANGLPEVTVIYPGSVERTSFAEKDEPKGFFDITLQRAKPGQKQVRQLKFVRLPARPMINLDLGHLVTTENLEDVIRNRCAAYPEDAIVRLRLRGCQDDIKSVVSSRLIRELLPKTMNFQYGIEFREGKTKR